MSIQEHLNKIRNAVFGSEVRESIAKGIETAYDDASEKDNANMEVKIARGTHPNLRSRLEEADNKQQQTTAQLQQTEEKKADKSYVDGTKRDRSVPISLQDVSPEFIAAIEGGEGTSFNLYSIPKDQSVDYQKTNFVRPGKNKFNKDSLFHGGYYGGNGNFYEQDGYSYSEDLIPVIPGNVISFSVASGDGTQRIGRPINFITAYDVDGNAVGPLEGRNVVTYTVPEGITHIRLSANSSSFEPDFQAEIGAEITDYEPYELVVDYLDTTVSAENIPDGEITARKLNIPNNTLPEQIKFTKGSINYNTETQKILLVASPNQAKSELLFAEKGSAIEKLGGLDSYFNITLIRLESGEEYRVTNQNNLTSYEFEEDSYFRIVQVYNDLSNITVSDVQLFNREIYIQHSNSHSVVLKHDINLPKHTLPEQIRFVKGSVNYDPGTQKIGLVNSANQARSELLFARTGSSIIKSGELDTYFNITLIRLENDVEYRIQNTNNLEKYTFTEDNYFRITQVYNDLSQITESDIALFNKEIFISHADDNSVVLKQDLDRIGFSNKRTIVVPPSIPCVVGKESHIYMDNILQYGNYYTAERFEVAGKGGVVEGGFEYEPTESTTEETIKFNYYNAENLELSATTTLKPVPLNAGEGLTKKVIIIGESTTDNDDFRGELVQLFSADALNVEFLGTRGTAPALNEAIAGWKTDNFLYSEVYGSTEDNNAFFNPDAGMFDFSYYMTQQGYADVDYVFIDLGLNDIGSGYSPDTYITNLQMMIDDIRLFDPSIKIGIGLTNLPAKFENRSGSYLKDRLLSLINALIEEYGNRENEGYFLVPIYMNLDPYWDFPYEERAISKRNPKTTYVGTNTVHPSTIGYYKSADVHYNVIKYMASQE